MRSNVLFFAIGLFIADSALAGPCKPRTSASEEVTATSVATSETATTVLETSTDVLSETVTTVATSAVTTAVDITLTTSEAETSTAIDVTTVFDTATVADTTKVADTTSVADTTTVAETSAVAETTTTAPGPIATYSLRASGSPIDGATPQGNGQPGILIIFNPTFSGVSPRTYAVEPSTGRLQDTDTGRYVCAYYGSSSRPSVPAMVASCHQNGDDKRYSFMTCKTVNGFLSCTASRGYCVTDDETDEQTCTTTPGVYHQFYYRYSPNGGDYWYIGSVADRPAGYTSLDVAAIEV